MLKVVRRKTLLIFNIDSSVAAHKISAAPHITDLSAILSDKEIPVVDNTDEAPSNRSQTKSSKKSTNPLFFLIEP